MPPTSDIPAKPNGLTFNNNGIHIFPAEDDAVESRILRAEFDKIVMQINVLQGCLFSDAHSSDFSILHLWLLPDGHQITVMDRGSMLSPLQVSVKVECQREGTHTI